MKRDFWRAIMVGAVVAMGGVLLVHAGLNPPKKMAPPAALPLAQATCNATLAGWQRLKAQIEDAMGKASDAGARCRLLNCPELDCADLQDVRGTVATLVTALQSLARAPESLVAAHESPACGSVVTPQAVQLAPSLAAARQALDLCAERATCSALRAGHVTEDNLAGPAALKASAARIIAGARALKVSESPPPKITLDQTRYAGADAVQARIDPGHNRCLANGGLVGVFADPASGNVAGPPTSPLALAPENVQSMLIEAPATPGHYLVSVTGRYGAGPALASLPFEVEVAHGSACNGFAGRWETDRGVLTASVRHGVLRGTYRRAGALRPGFLTGMVKGRHFHGSWTSELGAGGAHLVLTAQGGHFIGTAGTHLGIEDGAGLWRGSCAPMAQRVTE
jgi:hypothetical protein